MLKIINCEQGTEEWLKARLGKFTASNFSKLITSTGEPSKSRFDLQYKIAGQELSQTLEDDFKSGAMERGNDLEADARISYEEHTFQQVCHQMGLVVKGDISYSPDGLVGDDGLVEFKCPLQKEHMRYLYSNKVPSIYKAQIQGGLFITDRKWCDFVSFNPDFIKKGKSLFIKRMFRDEEFIQKLEKLLLEAVNRKNVILKKINETIYL